MPEHTALVETPVEAVDIEKQIPDPLVTRNISDNDASERSSVQQQPRTHSPVVQHDDSHYPPAKVVVPVMAALYLSVFIVALDRTIIGTAIPAISNEFNSLKDIGWYGSSYLLAFCALQLAMGRLFTFYKPKLIFLVLIGIFELGSLICAAAPNSIAFIWGRAIAGAGSAGIFTGAITLMVSTIPLRKRPMYQGLFGAVFGISSVVGPLLGGVFTTKATWRWCFWINLPIGAIVVLVLIFILPNQEPPARQKLSVREKLVKLDPWGSLVLLPAIVCILLALEWGGSQYPWNDGRIIALLTLGGVLFVAFGGIQAWQQDNGTLPPRLFLQRSVFFGVLVQLCIGGSFMVLVYYLPIWFQAIKNADAVNSGVMLLPTMLSLVVGSIGSGVLVGKLGHYMPFLIVGTAFLCVGSGLITTWGVDEPTGKWIGFQILAGFGIGCSMQQTNIAAQTVLSRKDVPMGISFMMFAQSLGGAVFLSVAQNVLNNKLIDGLLGKIPDFDPHTVVNTGATALRGAVPAAYLDLVIDVYNSSLNNVFYASLGLAIGAFVFSFGLEWRSVKEQEKE